MTTTTTLCMCALEWEFKKESFDRIMTNDLKDWLKVVGFFLFIHFKPCDHDNMMRWFFVFFSASVTLPLPIFHHWKDILIAFHHILFIYFCSLGNCWRESIVDWCEATTGSVQAVYENGNVAYHASIIHKHVDTEKRCLTFSWQLTYFYNSPSIIQWQ